MGILPRYLQCSRPGTFPSITAVTACCQLQLAQPQHPNRRGVYCCCHCPELAPSVRLLAPSEACQLAGRTPPGAVAEQAMGHTQPPCSISHPSKCHTLVTPQPGLPPAGGLSNFPTCLRILCLHPVPIALPPWPCSRQCASGDQVGVD